MNRDTVIGLLDQLHAAQNELHAGQRCLTSSGTAQPARPDRRGSLDDQPSRSLATMASACSTVTVMRSGMGSVRLPPVKKIT